MAPPRDYVRRVPPPPSDPYATTSARAVWVEVVERRREWAAQVGEDHFEGVPAYDRDRWSGEIDDVVLILREAMAGERDVDPRAAAIDVLAVVAALIDAMG